MIPSMILGTVLLVIGLLLKFSSVKRNSFFGYRTFLSMKNEDNWNYANRTFARHSIIIGIISISVGGLSSLVPFINEYIIFALLTLLLVSIIRIEIKLKMFDKNHQ